MRIIDYTCKLAPLMGANIHYRNPRFWDGTAERCDWVNTDNLRILSVYEAAGIPKWEGMPEKPVTKPTVVPVTDTTIPEDWLKLAPAKKKSLASHFTNEKVTARRAEEILELEYKKQKEVVIKLESR